MSHVNRKQGFTLVELMLAMGFVSALLLAIAMTVIQIGNIYNTGITYKSVNQAGGSIASQLLRDINSSTPFDLPGTNPVHYVQQNWGGRLCIGQYSYIWNYGDAIQAKNPQLYVYSGATSTTPDINFIKVFDPTSSYCTFATTSKKDIIFGDSVELLDVGKNNLAVYSFSISSNAHDDSTNQRLYDISLVIGTNEKDTLDASSGSMKCQLPDNVKSDPTYCAVNQFDIVARAGNKATK